MHTSQGFASNLCRLGGIAIAVVLLLVVSNFVSAQVFTLNPTGSAISISGTGPFGAPIQQQNAGSLTAHYDGTIQTAISGTTIQFTGLSAINAEDSGNWQPLSDGSSGSEPANYGVKMSALFTTALAAMRFIQIDATSSPLTVTGGQFDSTGLTYSFPSGGPGRIAYNVAGLLANTQGVSHLVSTAVNAATTPSTLVPTGRVQTLTLPVDATFLLSVLSANDTTVRAQGQFVAARIATDAVWHGGAVGNPRVWDTGVTTNWFYNGSPDTFLAGDTVTFDDSAVTNIVILSGTLQPNQVTFTNNSKTYGFGGSGAIATPGGLLINGSGSVTLSNSALNSFTAVAINGGGLLTVANNASNSFGPIAVNNGTLAFNQPTNVTLGDPLSGGGTVIKQGTNVLALTAVNKGLFNGFLNVYSGTLRQGSSNALAGTVSVASGATFDINGLRSFSTTPLHVQGNGVGGLGAIVNNGAGNVSAFSTTPIVLDGDTTISTAGATWEMHNTIFTGNSHKLTKIGANDFWFGANSGSNDLGDVDIKQGIFGFEDHATMGNPGNTITVRSNATLAFYGNGFSGAKNVIMETAGSLALQNNNSSFAGSLVLIDTNSVTGVSGKDFEYDGVISGPGWLNLQTRGAFFEIYGTNNGTGGINVNDGFLRLTGGRISFGNNYQIVVHTNGASGANVVFGNNVPHVQLFNFDGPALIPTNVTIRMQSAAANDQRTTFGVNGGGSGNVFKGTLVLTGDGNISIGVNGTGDGITISGPVTNANYAGSLGIRGAGNVIFSGPIHTGSAAISQNFSTGSSGRTVTIGSTNNQWSLYDVFRGTLILGAHDALCTTAPFSVEANVNLAGYNQALLKLGDTASAGLIYNDSGTGQSVLTINGGTNISVWDGMIADSVSTAGGNVAVTIASGALYINGSNTYTGPTLVQNGGSLRGNGFVRSSVTIQSGGVVSPGASIGTLTISSNLVLSAGSTNIFEVNSTTLAHDLISGLKSVAYGGTLVISNLSVSPYTNGQNFQLFSATTRSGSFAAIVPDTPGPGLVWNTNNLVLNGSLVVGSSVSTTQPYLTNSFTQTTLTLSWAVDHVGWRLHGQTNSVQIGLTTNWFEVPNSKTTNQIVLGLSPTNVACFYRLIYP